MDNEQPRIKRAYNKKSPVWGFGKPQENPQETPVEKPEIQAKEIRFEDLPESTRKAVEGSIAFRISKGLQDDSENRKRLAVEYFKYDLGRRGL
jgi:hypothetical protein